MELSASSTYLQPNEFIERYIICVLKYLPANRLALDVPINPSSNFIDR